MRFGFRCEINLEGTLVADVKTGVLLKTDLVGQSTMSGGVGDMGKRMAISVTGTGKSEVHEVACSPRPRRRRAGRRTMRDRGSH